MRNPIRIWRSATLTKWEHHLPLAPGTFGKLTRLDNRSRSPGSDPRFSKFLLQETMRQGLRVVLST